MRITNVIRKTTVVRTTLIITATVAAFVRSKIIPVPKGVFGSTHSAVALMLTASAPLPRAALLVGEKNALVEGQDGAGSRRSVFVTTFNRPVQSWWTSSATDFN